MTNETSIAARNTGVTYLSTSCTTHGMRGKPHFRVGDKIFAGCGEENGKYSIGFKLEMDHVARIIKIPGFTRALIDSHATNSARGFPGHSRRPIWQAR